METLITFGIIALAALIHSSFQLSVSMATLLSGHSIGSKTAYRRTMRLILSFLAGALVMTTLFVSFISYVATSLFGDTVPPLVWAAVCGLMVGLGIAVWTFYYRRTSGTTLWIPRSMARFLSDRAKATKHSSESFSLGLTSIIAEGLFILPPVAAASLALITLDPVMQLAGVALYVFIASLTLIVVVMLIGSGHKLSRIQKWREDNKRFLQFAAGSGLLVLGFYIYANEVVTALVANSGGF